MAFDPSIFSNVSSRTLVTGCCDDCDDVETDELTFTPELLYFAYVLEGEESELQPFTVINSGTLPVGITSVEVTGDYEITGTMPVSLLPGASFTMYIQFKPTNNGARLGNVIIDAGTAGPQPCVHLIGVGGEDTFTLGLADLQSQVNDVIAVNASQAGMIASLQDLLDGYVSETPVYMWRAYANSPDGRTDFTTGVPGNRSFIGLAFNKESVIPSEVPEDYEWNTIGVVLPNVLAFDTENVAGRPSIQILSDLDNLSLSLLAYEFNNQEILDYVNALLYVDGTPVNAEIVSLKNIFEDADEALAETLSIIGAKSLDGLSFNMDMTKVYVGPDLSLAMKLDNMVALVEDAEASLQVFQEAVASAGYAYATDLALLGAKNIDNSAFILDLDTVRASELETLAQYINTVVAAGFGDTASVTQLYEAVITPDGGADAKAMVQLDVNGHVVGYSATNGDGIGDMTFVFDTFNIIHPGTDEPVFSVAGGVVKMTNVEIDTLKVGSVLTESIALNQVTKKIFFYASLGTTNGAALGNPAENTWAEFGLTGNKVKVVTPDLVENTEVNIRVYINKQRTGGDNDRVWYRLKRTAPGAIVTYIGDTIKSGMPNHPVVFSYEWNDVVTVDGAYSYTLEYYRDSGEGQYFSAKMIAEIGKR